jgi:hypothetical protein
MNPLRRTVALCALALFSTLALAQAPASAALNDAQRKNVLQQAHDKHNGLAKAGLVSFHCEVHPDWDAFIKELKLDPKDPAIPLVKQVLYTVEFSTDGDSTVTYPEIQTADADLADRVRKTANGIEQLVSGFLKSWTFLGVATPLPETDSDYEVTPVGNKYRVTYREGEAPVQTTITQDFAVEEVNYGGTDLTAILHPRWLTTPQGFLLSGYDGETEMKGRGSARLDIHIDYETVDGLPLPSVLKGSTPSADGPIEISVRFTNYQVKKR